MILCFKIFSVHGRKEMIPQSKYIIFVVPQSQRYLVSLRFPPAQHRSCKFNTGNYNKKLVRDILTFNGLYTTGSERDRRLGIYWGTCLEVSNHQISLNGSNDHYYSHVGSSISNNKNYAGNLDSINILSKYNHFPNSKIILGNKAEFAYLIQNNPNYDKLPKFLPYTYILPRDRDNLFNAMRSHPTTTYISKPPNGCCGNGIKIVTYSDFHSLPTNTVVSEYISKPLCIDGFKFDLRVYVLVTSFCPLRAFVAKEGLARFATESYSPSGSVYSQLTNATLNKKSRTWESGAFKWKLSELLHEIAHRYRNDNNATYDSIMDNINSTIATALAFIQPSMVSRERKRLLEPCFELYGFDLLFDRSMKIYLLEINTMPSLNTDEDVDYEVKAPMLAQAFSIVGIPDMNHEQLVDAVRQFRLPEGGLEWFDQQMVKEEDERNRLSGNGFIRIFPSEKYSAHLEPLLVKPRPSVRLQKLIQSPSSTNDSLAENENLSTKNEPQNPRKMSRQRIMVEQRATSHTPQTPIRPKINQEPIHPIHFSAKNVSSENNQSTSLNLLKEIDSDSEPTEINNTNSHHRAIRTASNSNQRRINIKSSSSKPELKQRTLPSLALLPSPSRNSKTNGVNHLRVGHESNGTSRVQIKPKTGDGHKDSLIRPSTSGGKQTISPEFAASVLAIYLGRVDTKIKNGDKRLAARTQCFLVAQGYKVVNSIASVRSLLQHFSGKIRSSQASSSSQGSTKGAIPDQLREQLSNADDDVFKNILLSSNIPMVKNVKLLFR